MIPSTAISRDYNSDETTTQPCRVYVIVGTDPGTADNLQVVSQVCLARSDHHPVLVEPEEPLVRSKRRFIPRQEPAEDMSLPEIKVSPRVRKGSGWRRRLIGHVLRIC